MTVGTCGRDLVSSLEYLVDSLAQASWDAFEDDTLVGQYIHPDDNGEYTFEAWKGYLQTVFEEDGIEGLRDHAEAFDEIIANETGDEDETAETDTEE
jgi:hypothetical protein